MPARLLGAAALLAFSLWYLQPTVGVFTGMLDEGLVLTPADRILQGEVVYRDFFLFTGPLVPWLYAGFMGTAGVSVASAQLLLGLIRAGCVVLLYLVSARCLPPLPAAVPPLLFLFTYAAEPDHYANHWGGNLFLLLGTWALVEWAARPSRFLLAATGVAMAAALLTLHSFGAALVAAGGVTVAFVRWRDGAAALRDLAALAAGVAGGLAPALGYLAVEGALPGMWEGLITSNVYRAGFEFVHAGTAARLLLQGLGGGLHPFLASLLMLVPLLATFLGAPLLLARDPSSRTPVLVAVLASALAMDAACSYRLLPSQLQLHGYLSFVLLVVLLERWGRVGSLVVLALALPLGVSARQAASARVFPVQFPRGVARVASPGEAESLQRLVSFLERRLPPDRQAFFTPYEPNLYFLVDVRNPTRYSQMRALQYSREDMEDALRALARHPEAPVFHFPAFESEDFLRRSWPDVDLEAYRSQWDWFRARLLEDYDLSDHGAVQVYTRKDRRPERSRSRP